jgi:hypothetical protein
VPWDRPRGHEEADVLSRTCQHCGVRTKVEAKNLLNQVPCDKCKDPLVPPPTVLGANVRDLRSVGLDTKCPLLVVFSRPGCLQSKALMAQLAPVAARHQGRVLVFNVNLDDDQEAATTMGIRVTPTVMVGKRTALLVTHEGLPTPQQVDEWIRAASVA